MNYEHNLPDEEKLFETVIDTKRVAKVVKGGRNFSFSAIVVVGDRAGKIGVGDGKANEIADAIRKAKEKATKSMFTVPIIKGTIPHEIMSRFGASRVMMKPASPGTGVIAGSSVRTVLELAGVKDVREKSIGSNNTVNMAPATIEGLRMLKTAESVGKLRGKTKQEILG